MIFLKIEYELLLAENLHLLSFAYSCEICIEMHIIQCLGPIKEGLIL